MFSKRSVKIGNIFIGGKHKVAIQSMTNTLTKNVAATSNQINKLVKAGCDIVRVSVLDKEDALAIKEIKKNITCPLVADIHFDYQLAIQAIESGADKIRINPGNIGSKDKVLKVIEKAREYHIPIRIGINSGSIEPNLLIKYGGPTPEAMLESMENHVKIFEEVGFTDLVLSIKSTDIETTIKTNILLAKRFNYPIHVGLTEAGTINAGTIRSSYALGVLLNNHIGDTIRVSLNGDPLNEIPVCKEILSMFNLYKKPTLICCPTCGRTQYDMVPIVNEIEAFLINIDKNIKVAIMGCVVNGPGEAKEADIGIAGGKDCAILFKKGEIIGKYPQDEIVKVLKEEIIKL